MNQLSYAVRATQLLDDLMDHLSENEALEDMDIDIIDGVLTAEFEDGSKMIINRQEPLEQIWLASPEGPAHFSYNEASDSWVNNKTGDNLLATLNRILTLKTGNEINLPL